MKKRLLILVAVLATIFPASSQGIVFEELTFQEALDKAAASGKLLFVDCYTEWCGPCKRLAGQVFTQEDVGAFFNEHFINLRVDMEKDEGPTLARRYAVHLYPTLLVIRPDGKEQHRIIGFRDAAALIERAQEGCDAERSLASLEAAHNSGNREAGTITRYVLTLLDVLENEKAARVADDLFASLADEEKTNPVLWPLYANVALSPWGSSRFEFLRLHKRTFDRQQGKATVDSLFHEITTNLLAKIEKDDRLVIARLPGYIETLRGMEFEQRENILAEARFMLAFTRGKIGKAFRLYREHGEEFSAKGIKRRIQTMLEHEEFFRNHPSSVKLVKLIKSKKNKRQAPVAMRDPALL
ncbi:MAG: thioredoxin family protein [Odoribacteraceae bacterium]|nr:thioredoxin family protein [Odoribacteraceae bacterium]